MMRLPQRGLSAGMDRRKVVMCDRRGSDPASRYPGPKSRRWGEVPHRGFGSVHWDAPAGQRQGQLPSSAQTQHRAVKHGKSGGTTNQGKGKGSGEVEIG